MEYSRLLTYAIVVIVLGPANRSIGVCARLQEQGGNTKDVVNLDLTWMIEDTITMTLGTCRNEYANHDSQTSRGTRIFNVLENFL